MRPTGDPRNAHQRHHHRPPVGATTAHSAADVAQSARNRRSGWRMAGAVLVFHGLALFMGYRVLDRAVHPAAPHGPVAAAAPAAPARPPEGGARASQAEWPAWLAATRHHDTAAPWGVDAQGHVLLPPAQRSP